MPQLTNEREYRALATMLARKDSEKRIETTHYVEGYATTFNQPYLLFELEDGTKYYEQIDRHALDGADMSDVIMQYDHNGRVFARQSNGSLVLDTDDHGFFIAADLGRTEQARGLYEDIDAGMITKMSWAFTVLEEKWDELTKTRTILKVKKVYDVSAVSIPANDATNISARSYAQGRSEAAKQEQLTKRAAALKLRARLLAQQ